MRYLLGVSMPRSGHHLLERILKNTFGTQIGYCEFYGKDCCKEIPCKFQHETADRILFFQKSHDFHFTDPVIVAGASRVVQYRNPVPRSLSNYELHLRNGHEDNIRTFRSFLVEEAWYFQRFFDKWMAARQSEHFFLSYEELTADPLNALLRLFRHIGVTVDTERLSAGIAKAVTGRGDGTSFAPAEVFSHRYARQPVLANFEEIVIKSCPGYFPMRYFKSADADVSLIGLIFRAKKAIEAGDRDLALSLAEAANAQDPGAPQLARLRQAAIALPARTVRVQASAAGQ